METKTSDIEYSYFSDGVIEMLNFVGTVQYPDDMPIKDIYFKVVEEHPEHQIIFQSFRFDQLKISDLIYIG